MLWLVWLWAALAAAAGDISELECPLPEGAAAATTGLCSRYSACAWSGSGCWLTDQVGYVLEHRLRRRGAVRHAHLRKRSGVTLFGGDVTHLLLTETQYDRHRLRITFRDPERQRYEVPLALDLPAAEVAPSEPVYSVRYPDARSTFKLDIAHDAAHVVSMAPEFTYSDQFIEATLLLPGADDIYGMGENNHDSFRHDLSAAITWPIFARDRAPGDGHENLYGAHPFFLAMRDTAGRSYGLLFISSNAMEYKPFRLNSTMPALTFRTTGGILDMLLFFGDSPLEVVRLYQQTIGLPALPAYWAMGFQLSRFGYRGTDDIRAVHARNRAAGVPQDVQYSDIDYMDLERDFTLDRRRFGDMAALVDEFRKKGVYVTLIYDPAIAADFGQYPPVERGLRSDVFVRWMNSSLVPPDQCAGCKDYVVGYVWPRNKTMFPDFFQQKTVAWWTDEMMRFSELAGRPDGFWIDMNEPSNFGTNMRQPFNWPPGRPPWSLKCPHDALDDPPYPTLYVTRDPSNESKRISDKTICMSSKHINDVFPVPIREPWPERSFVPIHDWRHNQLERLTQLEAFQYSWFKSGGPRELLHYDVHSLYGWSETHATRRAMDVVLGGKRGLLVGRSTYPGAGRWASHWTGDNLSRWKDLKRSIVGVLEFNMFGIPHVGADICGFNGNTTERLCLRWMQLGAFYPFCRNHNTDDGVAQDPAAWPSVAAASRQALRMRYRLLPYLYTLFWRAASHGDMVVRPAAFQWPTRRELRGLDTQFLWGGGVMVAPVLTEESISSVNVTFPPGDWYDLRNGTLAKSGEGSSWHLYSVPMEAMIPVFARGGFILPTQKSALTTAAARRGGFQLWVYGAEARGELFWDDGETVGTVAAGRFYYSSFVFSRGELRVGAEWPDTRWMSYPYIERVVFHGAPGQAAVSVDGISVSSENVVFHPDTHVLNVTLIFSGGYFADMGRPHTVRVRYL